MTQAVSTVVSTVRTVVRCSCCWSCPQGTGFQFQNRPNGNRTFSKVSVLPFLKNK